MKLGWRFDLERFHSILCSAKPFKLRGGLVIPNYVDTRGWLETGNQGDMGSCSGWARAFIGALCNFYDTGGSVANLSKMFCYLTNQLVDGIKGDEGATIDGAIKAAREYGWCKEETFPYPNVYTSKIPKAALTEGKTHRLLSHSLITKYDEAFAALASCAGGIQIGIKWLRSLAENTSGVIESFNPARDENLGGHSVSIVGYTKRKKSARNYLLLLNSHDKTWGKDGYAEVSPSAIDAMLADRWTMFVFMSDLEEYKQRPYPTPGLV